MDRDNSDDTAAYGLHVPLQPLLQHRPAALQVHYLSSRILVQVQNPKAALSVHQSSPFLGVDAAGGRKAAGLYPGRAAVKVPAGHKVSPRAERRPSNFNPSLSLSVTHTHTHSCMHMKGICTHMHKHTQRTLSLLWCSAYTLLWTGDGGGWGVVPILAGKEMFSEVDEGEVLRRPGLQTFSPTLPVSLFEQAVSERKLTDFPEKLLDWIAIRRGVRGQQQKAQSYEEPPSG